MTSTPAQNIVADSVDEQLLTQYLHQHPDFFERHPQLLTRMRLQHPRNATTISLIERQVEVLREKQASSEQQLNDFVRVARANDLLAGKIHRFATRLMRTGTCAAALSVIETSLREDFDTHHAVLLVQRDPCGIGADSRFVRVVAGDDIAFKSFESLLSSGKPRCGKVRDLQRDFLFSGEAASITSVALVPLADLNPVGLLALGSTEPDRFHPGMSTEFLARIGALIAAAISRP
jgi:uncharacterized protein YigA (DUF484 family)